MKIALQGNRLAKQLIRDASERSEVSVKVVDAFYSKTRGEFQILKGIENVKFQYSRPVLFDVIKALKADGIEYKYITTYESEKRSYMSYNVELVIINKYL